MNAWAQEEMRVADFGDQRLKARAAIVLEQLGAHPQYSIPAACGGWSETIAAYRFFNNDQVSFEQVLAPHLEATLQRMAEFPLVLLVQDTTENDDQVCLGPKGLGTLKEVETHDRRLHPTIAFTPDRVCLGVVQALWWERTEPSPRRERRYKGVDEKESWRWVESYQGSCALQGQLPGTMLVNVADAEGDLYEGYAEYASFAPSTRAEWIVRAAQNRRVEGHRRGRPDPAWEAVGGPGAGSGVGAVDGGRAEAATATGADHPSYGTLRHRGTVAPLAFRLLPAEADRECRVGSRGHSAAGRGTLGLAFVDQPAGGPFRAGGASGGLVRGSVGN